MRMLFIVRQDLNLSGRAGESCDGIHEGFQAGDDASLGRMLVDFQLPQGLAAHDVFYKWEYE